MGTDPLCNSGGRLKPAVTLHIIGHETGLERIMRNTLTLTSAKGLTTGRPVLDPVFHETCNAARPVVYRINGRRQGAIARLASPSDVGELIKPFVFLDHAEVRYTG